MARKDLLRKAFRNNFLRKSVADLKSLATDKAHASLSNLRSPHKHGTPSRQHPTAVHPTAVRPTTPDSPPAPPTASAESDSSSSSSERTVTADRGSTTRCAEPLRPGASLRVATPELRREKRVKDPMRMTAAEIRGEMEEADAHHTASLLRSNARLLSECKHMLELVEKIVLAHVDTIQTALSLLEALEGMSPHVEGVKREMVGKLEGCERELGELVGVKGRVGEVGRW